MIAEAVDVYLEKPLDVNKLFISVKRLLRAGKERKRAKKRGEVLLGISSKVAQGIRKDALCEMLAKAVSEVTPFTSSAVLVLNPTTNRCEALASHNVSQEILNREFSLNKLQELFANGFKYEMASFLPAGTENQGPDTGEESYSQVKARKYSWAEGDQVLVEIRSVKKLRGFLRVDKPGDGLRPSNDSMRMFSLIANQIANILETGETYANQELLYSELEVMSEIVKVALSTFDIELVELTITRAAVNRFGHSFACFIERTVDENVYAVKNIAGKSKADFEIASFINSPETAELLRKVQVSKQPLHLRASSGATSIVGRGRQCSSLAVPVHNKGIVGHILLIEDDLQPEFNDNQVSAYTTMANQAELVLSRDLSQKSLEKTSEELNESYSKLKEANELNLRLQNMIKRYVPASTWQVAVQATNEDSLHTVENMPDMPVMFVDICGFSVLSEVAPPETIVRLLNIYFTLVSGVVAGYDGEVIKYIGDGAMAYFKHKENAILAANDILKSKNQLNQELSKLGLVEVDLHIGVACGPTVLCHVGPFYHLDRTLLGDTVNTASRLEGAALPGTVLFTMSLLPEGATPSDYGLVKIGTIALRGKNKLVDVLTFKRSQHLYMKEDLAGSTYLIVNKR
jgi:class 3 adenylate cyclase